MYSMKPCYRHDEYVLQRGHLDPSIDCTYVLIMEGSPREASIHDHISKAGITSRVVFQYNTGYKKCKKKLRKPAPNYDLEHANKRIFKHALRRGYKRIIVLEDDCEFDDRIRDPEVVNDLNTFLNKKNPSVYNLGPTFFFSSPLDILLQKKHRLLLYNAASHATIYNDTYMRYGVKHPFMMGHSDFETNRHISKYTYRIPLAYQKVVSTENAREGWGFIWPVMNTFIVQPSGIDKNVQPGYDNLKRVFDLVSVGTCLFLLLLIWLRE